MGRRPETSRVPPERIELPAVGALLRRHRLDDLDAVQAAIELSRDHLRPWMPWADQSREDTATFLERSVAEWDAGKDFGYVVTDARRWLGARGHRPAQPHRRRRAGDRLLAAGRCRGPRAGDHVVGGADAGGFALEGIERMEIHCDVANVPSAAVPAGSGYTLDRIEDKPITAPGELGRSMIWIVPPGAAGALQRDRLGWAR